MNNLNAIIPEAEGIHLFVYAPELPGPRGVVEERPQVEAVVIRTVVFSVVGRSEGGHFVPVD